MNVLPVRRGALSMLFVLVGTAGATSLGLLGWFLGVVVLENGWRAGFAAGFAVSVAMVLGLLRPTGRTEVVLAESLVGARFPDGWAPARMRGAAWFTGHVLAGAVVFVAVVLGLFVGVGLLLAPWTYAGGAHPLEIGVLPVVGRGLDWAIVLTGASVLSLTAGLVAVLPRVARWAAAVVLGPSPRQLLVIARARAARAAERNRVARELHDSVGRDLNLISVLATAAARTGQNEPRQRSYLDGVQSAARTALTNLDEALRVLRDGSGQGHWRENLTDLDDLLTRFRTAGLAVTLSTAGDLADLPEPVSREGYRIVSEALTNAHRHGTGRRATLVIECVNEVGHEPGARCRGQGLVGIGERAASLGGSSTHGEAGGRWRLRVSLPVSGMEGDDPADHRPRR